MLNARARVPVARTELRGPVLVLIAAELAAGCKSHHETPAEVLSLSARPTPALSTPAPSASLSATRADLKATAPSGMLRIPGGTAFLDRTEVTVGDYSKCVERGVCKAPALKNLPQRWLCTWLEREAQPLSPVDCVSRDEATTYCESIGKRLPSRVEWLGALESQHPSPYLWEKEAPELDRALALGPCWGTAGACVVPHFEPPSGKFADLVGNVQEWAAGTGEVAEVLGLGWSDPDPHDPELLQVDRVRETRAAARSFAVGFRCARSES